MPGTRRNTNAKAQVSDEHAIDNNWLAEVNAKRRMLERQLIQRKKERLHEINSFITNFAPEVCNMTMGDLMKMQLGHLQSEETEENSTAEKGESRSGQTERSGSIESAIDKALKDLHKSNEDTDIPTKKRKRPVKKAPRSKRLNTKQLLETPSNLKLPDDWKNTPAITPHLQSRIHHATPLTSIREASATDYRGMTFKFVAFNDRGSPVAPNELDCPDIMGKLSKLVKKAEKVFDEKRNAK